MTGRCPLLSLAVLSLALQTCGETEDYAWVEGQWIQDAVATTEANRALGVSEEYLEAYAPLFGRLRWDILDHTLTFSLSGVNTDYEFEVVPVSSSSFKLVTAYEEHLIQQTGTGFCAYFNDGKPIIRDGEASLSVECFKLWTALANL